jgi:hypothetical protein
MKKASFLIFGFILTFAFFANVNFSKAGSALLTWNANSESDLSSYKIYYDTVSHSGTCPGGYANSLSVPKTAYTGYWFDSLTVGQNYYFQVTAIDTSNNESACSVSPGEVSKLVTYRGDINATADHKVDSSDFAVFSSSYGQAVCGPTNKADINRDCVVDINDFTILASEYGQSF